MGEKKKVDSRIRNLIEGNVQTGHRSFFVIVGDRGREQIVNLHYILSKSQVAKRPTVLWCFKKELELSSHRKKRMNQVKKMKQLGSLDVDHDDPFELFITSTNISYVYYGESERVLGNTYGMCVLQDFEALTPNLLARTMETVQGGGIIVLLLKTMASLKQLCTMVMDVHSRYRTESQHDSVARFNERFLLSLSSCSSCLVVDDQLNVLPISSKMLEIAAVQKTEEHNPRLAELEKYTDGLKDELLLLGGCAKTVDQARTVTGISQALNERILRSTISVTAARGRGKSAAVGLALASAVNSGYANIFVTAPGPENVKTLFEFLFKGLEALGYVEHIDYDIVQSIDSASIANTNNSLGTRTIVRVNIYKNKHRQTVLYIPPTDCHLLGQAELLAIDEAAAIPLPTVQALLSGPHITIMSSTINGYEGTGRSLSIKLLSTLRTGAGGRTLKEFKLEEPIRYAPNDPVEKWLNALLCLDVSTIGTKLLSTCPHPSDCQLFIVNRDTLFSYHKASEAFLQRLMSLFVSSHYKNTPNDLQLMSDAPGHLLFVLLPPVDEQNANSLPEILAAVQVCYEGKISRQSVLNSLARGKKAAGDLIPWTLSQQFQDDDFASLSGARVVRVATHPEYQGMGYGSRAVQLLEEFFAGRLVEEGAEEYNEGLTAEGLGDDALKPRSNLKPLMTRVNEVLPTRLHWLGTSFGLTQQLFRFWKRLGFAPVYLRQTSNEVTGEHTTIVVKSIGEDANGYKCSGDWVKAFSGDFKRRFLNLMSFQFRQFTSTLCLSVLEACGDAKKVVQYDAREVSAFDLKRLEGYANNALDYHMILDLLPNLALNYFTGNMQVSLSPVQQAIILTLGLQHKSVESVASDLNLPVSQVLAMFAKCTKKIAAAINELKIVTIEYKEANKESKQVKKMEESSESEIEAPQKSHITVEEIQLELMREEEASKVDPKLRAKQRELINSLDLEQFAISGDKGEWEAELGKKRDNLGKSIVSIPSNKKDKKKENKIAKDLYQKHVVEAEDARSNKKSKHSKKK